MKGLRKKASLSGSLLAMEPARESGPGTVVESASPTLLAEPASEEATPPVEAD
jgi:hypothetical protein